MGEAIKMPKRMNRVARVIMDSGLIRLKVRELSGI